MRFTNRKQDQKFAAFIEKLKPPKISLLYFRKREYTRKMGGEKRSIR